MVIPKDDDLLRLATKAARAAQRIIEHYYDHPPDVIIKGDGTPVTAADREAEEAIAAMVRSRWPDHAFFGEEGGMSGESEVLWLVDPLDGTKSFVRRTPFFSTQIAVMVRGELRVGVSNAPRFDELASATMNGGATINDREVRVSSVASLEQAAISLGNIQSLAADTARWSQLGRILARVNRTRGYGDFCHYHYLARGAIDAVIESDVNILDIAALTVIVRAAGGVVTDLDGEAPGLETRSVVAANPVLHARIMETLHG